MVGLFSCETSLLRTPILYEYLSLDSCLNEKRTAKLLHFYHLLSSWPGKQQIEDSVVERYLKPSIYINDSAMVVSIA